MKSKNEKAIFDFLCNGVNLLKLGKMLALKESPTLEGILLLEKGSVVQKSMKGVPFVKAAPCKCYLLQKWRKNMNVYPMNSDAKGNTCIRLCSWAHWSDSLLLVSFLIDDKKS